MTALEELCGSAASPAVEQVESLPPGQRVMLLSYNMPPALTGSAVIVDQLSREFSGEEMVLAGASWPGMRQQRDPHWPVPRYVASAWRWPIRGMHRVRWLRWFMLPLMMFRLLRMCRKTNYKWLICVFPDEYFLFAGYLLARWTGVRFYPYFHNSYADNRQGIQRSFAQWLEPRVFRQAEVALVMSAGLQRHYQRKYPEARIEPLLHTYHGELPNNVNPRPLPGTTSIAILGTLNESNEDAIGRFARTIRNDPSFRLTIYTGTPLRAFQQRDISGPNITVTQIAPDRVVEELARHDVLFLPHGLAGGLSDVEYATIFPTRTLSYLIAGRPILAHVPENSFLASFLKDNKCAELVYESSENALRTALVRLRNDDKHGAQLVRNALLAAKGFQGTSVAQHLRRLLMQPAPATTAGQKQPRHATHPANPSDE